MSGSQPSRKRWPHPYWLIALALILGMLAKLVPAFLAAVPQNGFIPGDAPFGGDFVSFYTASQLALAGKAVEVYSIEAHAAAQRALFGDGVGYMAFFYPPTFLLLCLPLGLVAYVWSVLGWLIATLAAYALVMRRYAGGALDLVPILAFSGVYITLVVGQNALLSTALMGLGAWLLPRRPALAGLAFGLLCYKPHLGLLIPFALLAAGQWRAIFAAAATVITMVGLSVAVFGTSTWLAFLAGSGQAVLMMETSDIGFGRMIMSFFGAVQMLNGPVWLGYGLQAISALGVILTVVMLAWRVRDLAGVAVLIPAGTVLITPFLLAYDLTLLAIPLIWLYRDWQISGEGPGERVVAILAFAIPGIANVLARELWLPLAPFVAAALFIVIAKRIWQAHQAQAMAPSRQ